MLLYGWKVVCFAVSLSGTLFSQNHAKSRLDITSVSILLTHGHTHHAGLLSSWIVLLVVHRYVSISRWIPVAFGIANTLLQV
ncbi:hypothetical protein BC629DRAFT_1456546, partial [Irpex lacteus]